LGVQDGDNDDENKYRTVFWQKLINPIEPLHFPSIAQAAMTFVEYAIN
jgi:hypothetical protein